MTQAEKLRRRGHELRMKGCKGWPILRVWRWWRAERLLERADVLDIWGRYRPRPAYWTPCEVQEVEQ